MIQGLSLKKRIEKLERLTPTTTHKDRAENAEWLLARNEAVEGDPGRYLKLQWPRLVLDNHQVDLINAVMSPSIWGTFIKGCTGSGKGASAAVAICAYYDLYNDAKVILTSSTADHAERVIFAEVATWMKSMSRRPTVPMISRIGDLTERFIRVVNPFNGESFSGTHGAHVLFVFDEASGIPDGRFDLARTQAKKFLAMSNPRTLFGFFRQAFPKHNPDVTQTVNTPYGAYRLISVDGADCCNVRNKCLDKPVAPQGGITIAGREFAEYEPIPPDIYELVKPIIPGQTCYDEFMGLKSNPDPDWVRTFAHGKFPDEDPQLQLILSSWLDTATKRHDRWRGLFEKVKKQNSLACKLLNDILPVTAFGLDVAASLHGDETILAAGSINGVRALHPAQFSDTMQTCGWVLRTAQMSYGIDLTAGRHPIAVDVVGLGKGAADRLKEMGCWVIEMAGNDAARNDRGRYANRRAEMYGILGRRMDPNEKSGPFALPNDAFLLQELIAPEKVFVGSDGLRFRITPKHAKPGDKDTISVQKKLGGRSPDRADAVAYLYFACDLISEGLPGVVNRPLLTHPDFRSDLSDIDIDEEMPDSVSNTAEQCSENVAMNEFMRRRIAAADVIDRGARTDNPMPSFLR